MMDKILRFLRDDGGPTAVEYAVMLAMIVGMMTAAITYVGLEVNGMSEATVDALDGHLDN